VQRFLDLESNGASEMGCRNRCAFLLFRILGDAVSYCRSFVLPTCTTLPGLLLPSLLLPTTLGFAITAIIVTVIIIATSIFVFIAISPASREHILVDIRVNRAGSD
jgi:hypothetical protein